MAILMHICHFATAWLASNNCYFAVLKKLLLLNVIITWYFKQHALAN